MHIEILDSWEKTVYQLEDCSVVVETRIWIDSKNREDFHIDHIIWARFGDGVGAEYNNISDAIDAVGLEVLSGIH